MQATNDNVVDTEQREQALDTRYSFIVQAPAGSGKTELLTQRYLALLAQVNNPEEIIAITFTRKAAAEMRTRVINALQLAQQATPPQTQHTYKTWQLARGVLQQQQLKNWNLLENTNRLRIQTIDALCASLTRQMPILSRFGAQPEIIDDPFILYKAAARAILATLEQDTSWTAALTTVLLHLDNNYNNVEKLLSDMLARREQWLPYIAAEITPNELRRLLEQSLQNTVANTITKLNATIPREITTELLSLARFAAQQLATTAADSAICACADLTQLPSDHQTWLGLAELMLTDKNDWRKKVDKRQGFPAPGDAPSPEQKKYYQAMKLQITGLLGKLTAYDELRQLLTDIRHLPPTNYTDSQWNVLLALFELLPVLVAQLQLLFQSHGAVDYLEIAQNALTALGDAQTPTDLALALDYKIQHILIDEFQDTSVLQFRLLERLTAGWQPDDGRTLFLVGDPMQSIYRFRKAEVGLFLQAREQGIGAIYLKSLTLSVNFRSTAAMVAWFNQTFQTLLPATANISVGAIPYTPSSAANISASNGPAVKVHSLLTTQALTEAELIVQLAQTCLTQNPEQSIAILVRARPHLTAILQKLQSAGIAYHAVEIDTLAQRPVIHDLLALTRALLHPADRIAWLAILRAPWCGLTLADLHVIAGSNQQATLWELLLNRSQLTLSLESEMRLARVCNIIAQSLQQQQRQSLARWIKGTWLALGGPACLSQANELNDAATFFTLLKKLENGGTITDINYLTNQLKSLYATPLPATAARIEVMTIHKAKGLEFDTVILPGLSREPKQNDPQLLYCLEHPTAQGGVDLLLAPIKATETKADSIHDYLRYEENKCADYETVRLLYVAATRARQTLHLMGTFKAADETCNEITDPSSNSLLASLWPVLANEFKNNIRHSEQRNDAAIQTLPVIKRLTTTWQLPPTSQSYQPTFNVTTINHAAQKNYVSWNSNTLRVTGTVIHLLLYQISQDGLANWQEQNLAARRPYFRSLLLNHGIASSALENSLAIIECALQKTLADPRGRWLLDNCHADAQAEYALTTVVNNKYKNIIIDRTFIDAQGSRWIIDYKTAQSADTELDAFLAREIQLYQPQLEEYACIMQTIDPRPIKLGLYFPLLSAWHEWEHSSNYAMAE